ncbi:peptidoglycan-binding protein [Aminipila sp.]|uniref:peptidoglycan-binding protein n=1 Tax=Aminipila sp. TaxID=2060095 RepID=UPI002F40E106
MSRKRNSILAVIISIALTCSSFGLAFGHSGRTDSSGGHHDYNNVSGLGYYHYHHGMGPHLHPNGICPYATTSVSKSSNSTAIIKAAQQKLKDLGYYTSSVDGSFGTKSKDALKAFQKDYGLDIDGKLGPKSKAALGIE